MDRKSAWQKFTEKSPLEIAGKAARKAIFGAALVGIGISVIPSNESQAETFKDQGRVIVSTMDSHNEEARRRAMSTVNRQVPYEEKITREQEIRDNMSRVNRSVPAVFDPKANMHIHNGIIHDNESVKTVNKSRSTGYGVPVVDSRAMAASAQSYEAMKDMADVTKMVKEQVKTGGGVVVIDVEVPSQVEAEKKSIYKKSRDFTDSVIAGKNPGPDLERQSLTRYAFDNNLGAKDALDIAWVTPGTSIANIPGIDMDRVQELSRSGPQLLHLDVQSQMTRNGISSSIQAEGNIFEKNFGYAKASETYAVRAYKAGDIEQAKTWAETSLAITQVQHDMRTRQQALTKVANQQIKPYTNLKGGMNSIERQ